MIAAGIDLSERKEVCCADCNKPLVVTPLADDSLRFDACGRDCRDLYNIPEDCILFGPKDGPLFIYRPKRAGPQFFRS